LRIWLNRNDEACRCWPGEVLVSELKQIWADAKVTKTELRKLTAVLRSIHKQWAVTVRDEKRREADLFVQQRFEYAAAGCGNAFRAD
jgi:hypothetical protein